MTKDRLFEFLILLGSLEYYLESFAVKMDKEILLREMMENSSLN